MLIEIERSMIDLKPIHSFIEYADQVTEYLDLNYSDFFVNYMSKNTPCVIRNVANTWNCTEQWIENDTINFKHFINTYGDLEAPVADCDLMNFNAHCKTDMKVRDYMQYLHQPVRNKLLYLKDWHLQKIRPNDQFYKVPEFFGSDWLNEFATDHKEDDFMFVYIGPKNSWTPLHVDVYSSYSWSVNVVGRKKWILFPPGEEEKLKDSLGNLPLMFNYDSFPNVKYLEIIQERGEALFVPSGWHHEVINLLDTISINHNWVNACNIEVVWLSFQQCLQSIQNEIIDLKDTREFVTNCQIMLKSLFGMNYADFVNFISYISKKRINQLHGKETVGFHNFELGRNHITFDLRMIYKIMNSIEDHPLYCNNILSEDNKCDFNDTKNEIASLL